MGNRQTYFTREELNDYQVIIINDFIRAALY